MGWATICMRAFCNTHGDFHMEKTAIVPVIKPGCSIRICGDYKQIINGASDCEKYPITWTKDLLSLLGGGKNLQNLI